MKTLRHPASFRDPSGFIFIEDSVVFRQINQCYRKNYDYLMSSGLYETLAGQNLIIPHIEAPYMKVESPEAYKVIKPEPLSFISYPYEWCFGQLKDAALLTLRIQRKALEFEMALKDASAYNIQFWNGKPVLIDTLSFDRYTAGSPWIAYRQFCQHFLAPLSLMKYRDIRFGQLLRVYLDGIPLDFASSQLPLRSRFSLSLYSHIHLHAKYQQSFADKTSDSETKKISRLGILGIIDSLESGIKRLEWQTPDTEWGDYYDDTNYSEAAFDHKKRLIDEYLEMAHPGIVFDMGANTGEFSRLASERGIQTISFDIDPVAVEKNYQNSIRNKDTCILPLLLDLTNPSPGLGWAHEERSSLMERGPADMLLALALIHHLAISNNLPFIHIAKYFATLGDNIIIEFVPKEDSQVQRLFTTRKDIFSTYHQDSFEKAFKTYFDIKEMAKIEGSHRVLYLMEKR